MNALKKYLPAKTTSLIDFLKLPISDYYSQASLRILTYCIMALLSGLFTFVALKIYSSMVGYPNLPLFFFGMYAWATAVNFGLSHMIVDQIFSWFPQTRWHFKNRTVQKTLFLWFIAYVLFFIIERTIIYKTVFLQGGKMLLGSAGEIWQRPEHLKSFLFCAPFWLFISCITLLTILKTQLVIKKNRSGQNNFVPTSRIIPGNETIILEKGKDIIRLNLNEITHISVEDHYLRIFINKNDQKDMLFIKMSLKKIKEKLPKHDFFHIHRSHIANKSFIKHLKKSGNNYTLALNDLQTSLPVSRQRVSTIKSMLKDFN